MTQKQIDEGNILIAEFMGKQFFAYNASRSYDRGFKTYKECLKFIERIPNPKGFKPELGWQTGVGKYHSDWNWIMGVIEKLPKEYIITINSFSINKEFEVNIEGDGLGYSKSKDLLMALFESVIKFLKDSI